jgi:hypothetical protein
MSRWPQRHSSDSCHTSCCYSTASIMRPRCSENSQYEKRSGGTRASQLRQTHSRDVFPRPTKIKHKACLLSSSLGRENLDRLYSTTIHMLTLNTSVTAHVQRASSTPSTILAGLVGIVFVLPSVRNMKMHKLASLLPTWRRGLDRLYSKSLSTDSLQDLQRPHLHGVTRRFYCTRVQPGPSHE